MCRGEQSETSWSRCTQQGYRPVPSSWNLAQHWKRSPLWQHYLSNSGLKRVMISFRLLWHFCLCSDGSNDFYRCVVSRVLPVQFHKRSMRRFVLWIRIKFHIARQQRLDEADDLCAHITRKLWYSAFKVPCGYYRVKWRFRTFGSPATFEFVL